MNKRKNDDSGNFFTRILDRMEERRRRQNRIGCYVMLGFGAFFAVAGVIMSVVILITSAVEASNLNRDYGEAIASLCNPTPAGTDSLDNLPDDNTPPLKLLILKDGSQARHVWHNQMPDAWQATSGDDVKLVACVTEQEAVIEVCPYWRDSDEGGYNLDVDRAQYTITLVVVNPVTGRRIATYTETGSVPSECPDDFEDVPASRTISGGEPQWSDFAANVESLIFLEE